MCSKSIRVGNGGYEDIEINFVNDTSPDDGEEIIRRTLEEYPRLKRRMLSKRFKPDIIW